MSGYPLAFSSMVIDLIESIPYRTYGYSITKDIDAGGCCYIKCQYAVDTVSVTEFHLSANARKPLTVRELETYLKGLFNLARYQCLHYLGQLGWKSPQLSKYEKRCLLPEHCIVFTVDVKCRKKLAPFALHLKLLMEKSCDDNEDESASRAHTVQETSPDVEL
jgi:hypothetical protein